MGVLFRLLEALLKFSRSFYYLSFGMGAFAHLFVGEDNLKVFQKWLWGTPQEQQHVLQQKPILNQEVEALFAIFQQHMDTQYQVDILARYVLTLPALPEEGF